MKAHPSKSMCSAMLRQIVPSARFQTTRAGLRIIACQGGREQELARIDLAPGAELPACAPWDLLAGWCAANGRVARWNGRGTITVGFAQKPAAEGVAP
jgi:hypothetical protein